jgi:hypothetical protein
LGGGSSGGGTGGTATGGAGGVPSVSFDRVSELVLQNCASNGCHSGSKRPTFSANKAALYTTLTTTVSLACNVPLITPSDTSKSALLLIVTGNCSLFRMPPDCTTLPCIPESDIQTISAWVTQGAKGP